MDSLLEDMGGRHTEAEVVRMADERDVEVHDRRCHKTDTSVRIRRQSKGVDTDMI